MKSTQVTVLKLQIKYEDAGGLVPWELHIYFITEEGEESDNYKVRCRSGNTRPTVQQCQASPSRQSILGKVKKVTKTMS